MDPVKQKSTKIPFIDSYLLLRSQNSDLNWKVSQSRGDKKKQGLTDSEPSTTVLFDTDRPYYKWRIEGNKSN